MNTIRSIPLDELRLSALNPRHSHDPETLQALAASIRVSGLIHNLSGLVTETGVEIVAGGRRLAALGLLADQGDEVSLVPVRVTSNEAEAKRWAAAENTARIDLNPADEIAAFQAMAREGHAGPAIAAAFGVTEARVAQRLKLSGLSEDALHALRAGRINLSQAGALTLAQGDEQADDALDSALRGDSAAQLRSRLLRGAVRAGNDRRAALVGIEAYEAAGGELARDLFSDDVVIEDVALLDRLYRQAVDAERERLLGDGWGWIVALDESYIPWSLGERLQRSVVPIEELTEAQRALCGGWICIAHDGRVDEKLGYLNGPDLTHARALGVLPPAGDTEDGETGDGQQAAAPAFSAALLADMRAIRHGTLIAALLERPGVAMPLIAWAMSRPSRASVLDIHLGTGPVQPGIADGFTLHLPDAEAPDESAGPALRGAAHQAAVWSPNDLAVFGPMIRALRYGFSWAGSDAEAMKAYRQAEDACDCDMRDHWRPTRPGFFARVRGPYLEQVYCEIFELDAESEDARAFARMKKVAKENLLHMLFADDGTERGYRLMTATAAQRLARWTPSFE